MKEPRKDALIVASALNIGGRFEAIEDPEKESYNPTVVSSFGLRRETEYVELDSVSLANIF